MAAKADINQATADGATPVYIAAEKGHKDVVQLLVGGWQKANVNQPEYRFGFTTLHAARGRARELHTRDLNFTRVSTWCAST